MFLRNDTRKSSGLERGEHLETAEYPIIVRRAILGVFYIPKLFDTLDYIEPYHLQILQLNAPICMESGIDHNDQLFLFSSQAFMLLSQSSMPLYDAVYKWGKCLLVHKKLF